MAEDPRWRIAANLRVVLSEGEGRWEPRTHQHAHLLAQHFGADPGPVWWREHLDWYDELHRRLPIRQRQSLPGPVKVPGVDDTLVSPFHGIPIVEAAAEVQPTRRRSGTVPLDLVHDEVREWHRKHGGERAVRAANRVVQIPATGAVETDEYD